jgi:hypothetical protein
MHPSEMATRYCRLRSSVAALRFEIEIRKVASIRLERRYAPSQPRVPAGTPEGGRWMGGTGSVQSGRVQLAGALPDLPNTESIRRLIGRFAHGNSGHDYQSIANSSSAERNDQVYRQWCRRCSQSGWKRRYSLAEMKLFYNSRGRQMSMDELSNDIADVLMAV